MSHRNGRRAQVVFNLHASFNNPQRIIHQAPFELTEEGWGEFEMSIVVRFLDGGGGAVGKQLGAWVCR
jgi:transcription initiation factor IIF auxiliary subunit